MSAPDITCEQYAMDLRQECVDQLASIGLEGDVADAMCSALIYAGRLAGRREAIQAIVESGSVTGGIHRLTLLMDAEDAVAGVGA